MKKLLLGLGSIAAVVVPVVSVVSCGSNKEVITIDFTHPDTLKAQYAQLEHKQDLSDQDALNDGTSTATEKDFDFDVRVIYKDDSGEKHTEIFNENHPMDLNLIQNLFTKSGTGITL